MPRYKKIDPTEFLSSLRGKILSGEVRKQSEGCMLFNREGVIITDDIENEYISVKTPPLVVETPCAQEVSYLMTHLGENLPEVVIHYGKGDFYRSLASGAKDAVQAGAEGTVVLLSVLLCAWDMTTRLIRERSLAIRDELLSCVGGLSDLAEKIQ